MASFISDSVKSAVDLQQKIYKTYHKLDDMRRQCRQLEAQLAELEELRTPYKLSVLVKECRRKFGECTIECFSDSSYRVWVRRWHSHNEFRSNSGSAAGHGTTPEEALLSLFRQDAEIPFGPGSVECDICRGRNDDY